MENRVYLFPLSDSVLFKKVTIPYQIIEPHYQQLIRDSLKRKVPVGIVTFDPCHHYSGKICVAGMPHILASSPDGHFDIYITGTDKFLLLDPLSTRPYHTYSCRALQEDLSIDDSFEMEIESLKRLLKRWASQILQEPFQQETFFNALEDLELLVNYCALFLVDDQSIKREVMEVHSIKRKVRILTNILGPKEIFLGPFMPTLRF